jgi:hypothetical protein
LAADTVLDFTFTSKSNINQSLVRKNNQYQLHSQLPGRGLYSPGQAQTEYTSFAIPDPQLIEGDTHNLTLVGHHPIGLDTLTAKDFQWLSVDPHIAQIRPNASASPVHLSLYNLQGQRIRTLIDAPFNADSHQVVWDGLNQRGHPAATGLYLARLTTPTTQTHTKLVLLR